MSGRATLAMMSSLFRLVLAAPLLAGCFVDKPPGDDDATDGSAGGSTGGTGVGQSTTSVSDGDPTTPTTGAVDPTASACYEPPGQPLDSECIDTSGCGCQSGTCLVIPLVGGLCGQCTGDGDCMDGGCTMPDLVNQVGSRCNQGEPGAGCESDAVCSDPAAPRCAAIYSVFPLFEVRTCSACSSAADCSAGAPHCSPVYDFGHFTGVRSCVADNSLTDEQGCSLTPADGVPEGNAACASGRCGKATVQGLLELGVCGACNSDEDCLLGQTCSPATVDTMTGKLTGAKCL